MINEHNYGKSPCYQWVNPLFLWPFQHVVCSPWPLNPLTIQVAESEVPAREGVLEGCPKRPDLRAEKTNDRCSPASRSTWTGRKAVRLWNPPNIGYTLAIMGRAAVVLVEYPHEILVNRIQPLDPPMMFQPGKWFDLHGFLKNIEKVMYQLNMWI